MKPNRRQLNKRCPCGSNKAFKNCHGQEFLAPKTTRVPRYAQQDPEPFLEPPGYTYVTLTFSDAEGQSLSVPEGEPGEYEATFTLLQPGQAAEKVKDSGMVRISEIQNDKIEGDSHLALTVPKDARPSSNADIGAVVTVPVNKPDGSADDIEMILWPNPSGRLSKVSVTLQARNFLDAERRAHFEAASFLSYLSFELNVPLRMAHTFIKETRTGHTTVGFVRQFGYKGMGNLPEGYQAMKVDPFPALASVYREALNSDSPFYQFLCFCRVVQRLMKPLRPRWKKTIINHDKWRLPTYEKRERFPENGAEAERFPAAIGGEKFAKVYVDLLRPLRDGIAHVFLEDTSDKASAERSTDEHEFVNDIYEYVPAAHYMARTMLNNDFGVSGLATVAARLKDESSNAETISPSQAG